MAYAWRFHTEAEIAEIAERTIGRQDAVVPDETLQRAWEADLAANLALAADGEDADTKARGKANAKALEAALNRAAAGDHASELTAEPK